MAGAAMSELLAALPEKRVIGEPPRSVSSIAGDSRKVEPGACFVAVPGFKQDGRRFIPDAIRRGAAVVVTEGEPVADLPVAQVLVPSVRVSLARLAGAFYGHPSRQLALVGITGTNGKTTTSYLIEALLRARGLATGVIGTIQYVLGDETRPANQTTPEALDLQAMLAHMRGRVALTSPLVGEHNVMNLLGAVATGLGLGLEPPAIAQALAAVGTVPGRFEQVQAGQPFLVIVDYAHTPDALERVLTTARKLTRRRLAVVFGCGGDRDRGKRPIMGEIAARLCDQVWVTSDNPRSEQPEAIIDEIVVGVRRAGAAPGRFATEPDRGRAIAAVLAWAEAGDTVVIAGKGHETYQIVGADTLPFDDREVARGILSGQRT